jgi:GNAT superfamily N-acetyltransferase
MVSDTSLVVEAVSASELSRDETWWAIYAQAFPSREREPREVIVRSLEQHVGIALRARRGATMVGLATAHLLKTVPAVFLVYVATAPHARGGGAGRALVERTWQLGNAELQANSLDPLGMIWEIEDSDAARLRFFRWLGGELLARPYMQPPVDGVAPVPMRLMYRPAPGSQLPTEPAVDALVRAMYLEKYGDLNGIPVTVLSDLLRSNDSRAAPSQ